MKYSSLSRVPGVTAFVQLFSAGPIAMLLMGERIVYEAIVAVPWCRTVEWVYTVVHADGHLSL